VFARVDGADGDDTELEEMERPAFRPAVALTTRGGRLATGARFSLYGAFRQEVLC
jgi:hypothetical protein